MRKSELQFVGYNNSYYVFKDCFNKPIKFSKCRKELIEEFKLNDIDNNGKWFKINYFQALPTDSKDTLSDLINIISDMQLVLNK